MRYRLLICGARGWTRSEDIFHRLRNISEYVDVVIEGECRGADVMARNAAVLLELPVARFPADWQRYGNAAGPIRNQRMIDEGRPNLVWAFHDHILHSVGTKDMVKRSRAAGIRTVVFNAQGELEWG